MKVTCQYSGEIYTLPDFGDLKLSYVHPIFTAETKFLLSRTGDWANGRLNERERKLLFLSLLHTTELVAFKAPAAPADPIVQSNMEGLIRLVSWVDALKNPAVVLPSFVITHETRQLPNIRYWLAAWWEARKDFEDGYKRSSADTKQLAREKALERLIKTSTKRTEDYMGLLSTWAMEASNAPISIRAYWKQILTSRSTSIYNINKADLEEIIEHMEENLHHGSIFAHDFMKALRLLVAKNKAGLSFGLGMSDDAELDYKTLATTPFQIIDGDTDTEQANRALILTSAPEEMPVPANYPNRVAYLRAKIAWEMAEKARAYREDMELTIAQQVAQDAQDNAALEDGEVEAAEQEVQNGEDHDRS